jgi:DNA-binding MarR family transcriptional regulator
MAVAGQPLVEATALHTLGEVHSAPSGRHVDGPPGMTESRCDQAGCGTHAATYHAPVAAHADGPDLAEAGPALFRLVRFWSRRWVNRTSEELTGEMRHVQHILVVEAVDSAQLAEVTVATVAHQLGLDHSGASRMVRDAVSAGYLVRGTSGQDRRQAALHLTGPGRELLAGSHEWQRAAFARLTADWSAGDRQRFAGYLLRLADQTERSAGPAADRR